MKSLDLLDLCPTASHDTGLSFFDFFLFFFLVQLKEIRHWHFFYVRARVSRPSSLDIFYW